ncbi:MAG: DUF3224 domain-containing protein [Candidatus Dormibacteria bacterium]
MQTAHGDFSVASWDEKTYEELGVEGKLTRAHVEQAFTGDLEGTGTWDALMCYAPDGTASYVGFVRVVGRLSGRSGTFVAQTAGGYDGTVARWSWSVIKGTATDQLEGLEGQGECRASHGSTGTLALDHNL